MFDSMPKIVGVTYLGHAHFWGKFFCASKVKDKEVKKCCARDKQHWYDLKASEAEEAASKGDHKSLYRIVKELTR